MLIPGIALCFLAVLLVTFGTFRSNLRPLPAERRRYKTKEEASGLTVATATAGRSVDKALVRWGAHRPLEVALESAGLRMSPPDFVILVISGALFLTAIGWLLSGPLLGLIFAILAPFAARILLRMRASMRRKKFADQLDDTLQLLAGGLRAGHSLLRAIDAVSQEAESPTAEEFARVVNETRLGRDLNEALEQTASRMGSEDFSWVAQGIGIHREVGGDLSEVLDEVGNTIRERNQIRRQVAALSAEGKMSAYVLIALPFAVLGMLMLTSPTYVAKFVERPLGYVLMGVALVMITIGSLWMRKIVSFKF